MLTPSASAGTQVFDPVSIIAAELNVPRPSVERTMALLAEGATVPFIARYRKEQTGGLEDVQIARVQERVANRLGVLAPELRFFNQPKAQDFGALRLEKQFLFAQTTQRPLH